MTARELKELLNGIEEEHLDREIITFNTGNTDRHNIVSVCEEPDFDDYEELYKILQYKTMRVQCKICKRNLTSQAIALLKGKIKEIKCKCGKFNK